MPPSRSGQGVFSAENVIDVCQSEASLFSDEDPFLDKSNLMDLEEFMFFHKSKTIKKEQPSPCNAKLSNGDFLSELLKNVHKNLGLKVDGDLENVGSVITSDGENEKHEISVLEDHEYVKSAEENENENEDEKTGYCSSSKQQGRRRKPRTYKYNPKPVQQKTNRSFVPDKLKDEEYWERRKRNNQAAKKSREDRRRKELEVLQKMSELEQLNSDLTAKVQMLEMRNEMLEKKLKRAEMMNQMDC